MERLKNILKHLCRWTALLLVGLVVAIPVALPYMVEFHSLLVVPYYGLLMWTASLNLLAKNHTTIMISSLKAQSRCKKQKEAK
jgi:hypothetical protein